MPQNFFLKIWMRDASRFKCVRKLGQKVADSLVYGWRWHVLEDIVKNLLAKIDVNIIVDNLVIYFIELRSILYPKSDCLSQELELITHSKIFKTSVVDSVNEVVDL